MIEYEHHIEKYSLLGYHMYSHTIPELEWGNKKLATKYLEKYWLPTSKYETDWKPIQDQIFTNQDIGLPKQVFSNEYQLTVLRGGLLFEKTDYEQLQECMLKVGDKNFVIIENTFGGKIDEPPFRLKYPTNTTWEDLTSGNFISSILFEMFHKEYFVYSESGVWGKYAASDYENPLDIIGFKPEYEAIFKKNFEQSSEEWKEIKEWLPPKYKDIIK